MNHLMKFDIVLVGKEFATFRAWVTRWGSMLMPELFVHLQSLVRLENIAIRTDVTRARLHVY